jgi:hypothetical protein
MLICDLMRVYGGGGESDYCGHNGDGENSDDGGDGADSDDSGNGDNATYPQTLGEGFACSPVGVRFHASLQWIG